MIENIPEDVQILARKLDPDQLYAIIVDATAELAFDGYNEEGPNPWKTFDGRDVPRWAEINEQVRAKWRAAVRKVVQTTDTDGEPIADLVCARIRAASV